MSFYRQKIVPRDDDEESSAPSYSGQQGPQPPMTPTTIYQDNLAKDREITNLRAQVNNLQEKVQTQEQQLANQNIKIQQQAETIQIHSREISKPQVDKTAITPFRAYSHYGNTNPNLMKEPPPVFNPTSQPFQPANPNAIRTKWGPIMDSQKTSQPQTNQPTFNVPTAIPPQGDWKVCFPHILKDFQNMSFDSSSADTPPHTVQPSPGLRDMFSTPAPVLNNKSGPNQAPRDAAPIFTPEGVAVPSSMTFTGFNTGVNQGPTGVYPAHAHQKHNIGSEWNKLIDLTIRFTYNHFNVPSTHLDRQIPEELKKKLISAATLTTAARLLSTQSTRYFLIARIILEWFNQNVVTKDALKGLDHKIDLAIDLSRIQLVNPELPKSIKHNYVQDIRKQFQTLTQHPGFENHIRTISQQRVNELWPFIQPLKYVQTQNFQSDLLQVIITAYKLAAAQLCDLDEHRIYFIEANTPFNDTTMINMDTEYGHMSSEEVTARQGVVKLTVAPQIMKRSISLNGTGTTEILVKAGVLLKFREYMVKDLKR